MNNYYIPPPFPFPSEWSNVFDGNHTEWLTPHTHFFQQPVNTQYPQPFGFYGTQCYNGMPCPQPNYPSYSNEHQNENNNCNCESQKDLSHVKLTKEDYDAIIFDSDSFDYSLSGEEGGGYETEIVMNNDWKNVLSSALKKYNEQQNSKRSQRKQKQKNKKKQSKQSKTEEKKEEDQKDNE